MPEIQFQPQDVLTLQALLESSARIVVPQPLDNPVCRDPDDDIVLATALTGNCSLIISGDKDLTDLETSLPIRIVKPGEFWRVERELGS